MQALPPSQNDLPQRFEWLMTKGLHWQKVPLIEREDSFDLLTKKNIIFTD